MRAVLTKYPPAAIAMTVFVFASFLASACCQGQLIQLSEFFEKIERKEIDHSRKPHTYFDSKEQFLEMLVQGMRVFGESKERDLCLNFLIGRYPTDARKIFESLASNKGEELETRLVAIYILAMYRDVELLPLFKSLLDDPEISLGIAGMGGISFYKEKETGEFRTGSLTGHPNVGINMALYRGQNLKRTNDQWTDLLKARLTDDSELRRKLIHRMQHAESIAERQAAARAIVNWNADAPGLRLAEWGVWVGGLDNKFQLVKSVVDEIPDFVFHTPNLVDELKKTRLNEIRFVTKPILHFTTDAPVAIDLSVDITGGQVWFSYPKPSDFYVDTEVSGRDERGLRSIQLHPFESSLANESESRFDRFMPDDIQPPYSWFKPDTKFGNTSGGMGSTGNAIKGIGFSWFNLQIAPELPTEWQTPVSVDEKFKWWSELRMVKSSWVNNGQQTERFLYYDGPTVSESPVTVDKTGKKLSVTWRRINYHHDQRQESRFGDPCQALLIQVKDGRFRSIYRLGDEKLVTAHDAARGSVRKSLLDQIEFSSIESKWMEENETIDALYEILTSRGGLTNAEASGLVEVWKKQFLEINGTRLLARINQADYDVFCPLKVRPTPGELSRVGLVLFELGDFGPDWNPDARAAVSKLVTSRVDRVAEDEMIRTDAKVRNLLRKWLGFAPDRIGLMQQIDLKNDPDARSRLFEYLVGNRGCCGLLRNPEFLNELQGNLGVQQMPIELIDSFAKFRSPWSRADEVSRINELLDITGRLVEEGIEIPEDTAQSLAILIASQEKHTFGNATHLFDSLCAEIEPKISPLSMESTEHQRLVSLIERCIKGELECFANDSGIKARLLSPSGASYLLQTAMERAKDLAQTTPVDDRRIGKPLLIATWIAAFVHHDDAERLTQMTDDVQEKVGGRPPHLNHFYNKIKDDLSLVKQQK